MRIFHKLLYLLAGAAVLPLALTGGIVLWRAENLGERLADGFRATGDQAVETAQSALVLEARRNLALVVKSKAGELQSFFHSVRDTLDLQAELLRIQNREKKTMIFVTHSIEEAVYLADRVVVFTRRPSRILEIVDVPLPHPRWKDPEEFRAQPEFVRLRLHIAKLLKGAYA